MTKKGVFGTKKSKNWNFDPPKNCQFSNIFFKKIGPQKSYKISNSSRAIAISKLSDLIGRERFSPNKDKTWVFPGKRMGTIWFVTIRSTFWHKFQPKVMTKLWDMGKKADLGTFLARLGPKWSKMKSYPKIGLSLFCIPGPLTCSKDSEKTNERTPRKVRQTRMDNAQTELN